jgi:hypothetical protein
MLFSFKLQLMKRIIILFALLPAFASAEYDYGFMHELFFGRQPSARAEALGRSYTAVDGDLTTSFFNPAGTASLRGLEVAGSFSSPFYGLREAKYTYVSAGSSVCKYFTFGLSWNKFSYGEMDLTNEVGDIYGHYYPSSSVYGLNLSSEPVKDLYLGVNVNFVNFDLYTFKGQTLYFDFGAIKKFRLSATEKIRHTVNLAASVINLNSAKMKIDLSPGSITGQLPLITRFAAGYEFKLNKKLLNDSLHTFECLAEVEYNDVLNSDYLTSLHAGIEFTFLEIASLRAGYYTEEEFNYGYSDKNEDHLNEFTYGFGLQLPLYKLTKIPVKLSLDYTSLPQPNYAVGSSEENFSTFTVRAKWFIK